jgi:hypothetical protein
MHTLTILLGLLLSGPGFAGMASVALPVERMLSADAGPRPVPNAVFAPGPDALQAPAFTGTLTIGSSPLLTQPVLSTPVLEGRDARVFPGITLSFVSDGSTLIPVERGEMVRETAPGAGL